MKTVYCLFRGPGPGNGPVVAVQDHFGSQYRMLRTLHQPGEVLTERIRVQVHPERATDEGGYAISNFAVVRQVHPNTVYAILRRGGRGMLRLDRGWWHETHGD